MTASCPEVGTVIPVVPSAITFLNSNVPCVRLQLQEGKWVVVNPLQDKGLLCYITQPKVVALNSLSHIEITSVERNVAFAKRKNR